MTNFAYCVWVECETEEQAETVIGARLGYDEDLDFYYRIGVERERALDPHVRFEEDA